MGNSSLSGLFCINDKLMIVFPERENLTATINAADVGQRCLEGNDQCLLCPCYRTAALWETNVVEWLEGKALSKSNEKAQTLWIDLFSHILWLHAPFGHGAPVRQANIKPKVKQHSQKVEVLVLTGNIPPVNVLVFRHFQSLLAAVSPSNAPDGSIEECTPNPRFKLHSL